MTPGRERVRMPAAEASPWRVVGMASLVALAYYVGSWIGLLLAVPPGPTSALWPPNAILTAALLLTPVHRWWTYVLAVVPVHLLAQIGTVHPPALIAALFVTNWSEALLGAIGVRLFSDAPARLDTFQRMAIFIGAVGLGAPLVSSFADAAAVTALTGQEYWGVLRTRFFANVLTELAVASTILGAVAAGRRRTSSAPGRRAEAIALAAVVIAVGVLVFDGGVGTPTGLSSRTLVLLLLPVFLWGAVRFGPVGISASLLAVSTLAVWGAQLGRGPFATVPADERVLLLQVSSIMVTIPLLCVAAVVAERRDSARALRESLHFEKLISELSSACVRLPPERLDEVVFLLGDLADYLGLQSLTVSRISPDGTTTWYAWDASDRTAASDPGASAPAVLVVPLMAHDRCLGDLTLTLPSTGQSRATDWMPRITVVAEVLGSALADQEATRALRASESMNSAILASLTTRVAVLDREARVVAVNDAWRHAPAEPGVADAPPVAVGASYLEHWCRAEREGDPHASTAVAGIRDLLNGGVPIFSMEFPWRQSFEGRQWWAITVVPLAHPEGGAVVSLTDLTGSRRAEIEAQRMRQELAHVTRVSAMGELTSSLAHELNQPLTAILANAQAARRFLDAPSLDVNELRAILADIVEDDRRAGEIIHRLREMLAKGDVDFRPLDLNLLIVDVIKLLGSDLLIHNVVLTTDLAPDLPKVRGDRIQLQQVVLNLLLNAIDAVAADEASDRRIVVRTRRAEGVHVSVCDSGHGIARDAHDLVFQAFYTTKPRGMGMGLTICRSIIEAHGGLIWATDNEPRGAVVHFALPAEPGPETE